MYTSNWDKPYVSNDTITRLDWIWHYVWRRWWIGRICRNKFWKESSKDYPQTMYYMPHWRPFAIPIQWLCGRICGHERSKTDWGCGGGYVDTWCRWCNKRIKIPISEARFADPMFNALRPDKKDGRLKIVKMIYENDGDKKGKWQSWEETRIEYKQPEWLGYSGNIFGLFKFFSISKATPAYMAPELL